MLRYLSQAELMVGLVFVGLFLLCLAICCIVLWSSFLNIGSPSLGFVPNEGVEVWLGR